MMAWAASSALPAFDGLLASLPWKGAAEIIAIPAAIAALIYTLLLARKTLLECRKIELEITRLSSEPARGADEVTRRRFSGAPRSALYWVLLGANLGSLIAVAALSRPISSLAAFAMCFSVLACASLMVERLGREVRYVLYLLSRRVELGFELLERRAELGKLKRENEVLRDRLRNAPDEQAR